MQGGLLLRTHAVFAPFLLLDLLSLSLVSASFRQNQKSAVVISLRLAAVSLSSAQHDAVAAFSSNEGYDVADFIACSRRALKAATPEQCQNVFGYAPGTLPPCGHICQADVLIDEGLQQPDQPRSCQPSSNTDVECGLPGTRLQAMAQPVTNLCPQLQLDSQSQAESKTISNNLRQETHASHSPLNTPPFEHRTEGTASQQEAGSQQPQAQGPLANQLLFCGAGLPNAYLAVTFDQLVLLSKGRAVDLVQRAAPCKGCPDINSANTAIADSCGGSSSNRLAEQTRRPEAPPCTFLLDSMCGRLCRWLRCVGMDTELVGADILRSKVAQLSDEASKQGRVFLTRDHKLAEQRGSSAVYLLASDSAKEQFQDIQRRFGIRVAKKSLLSRCSQCNSASIQRVDPAAIQHVVDSKVFEFVSKFWQCQACSKVFWVGPKSDAAVQNILSLTLHEDMDLQLEPPAASD